jgi:hypothetical protein
MNQWRNGDQGADVSRTTTVGYTERTKNTERDADRGRIQGTVSDDV